ncbi:MULTISPECIES: glutamine synthetase family protein [Rhizobium/Agrobacterium group]|jgi:glutamine synthetase|uniref:glutamine synthetase family protein n=1 Tax=Rhizobium/Agrobacterium group TaxID=227290 RepID=UPI0006B8F391|nr:MULTISPECIES: glutamine synthetase family protein [Rhizobium/Agrobacterium group]AOG09559.1 glutamine synthetase, catalytic domain protein [Agrobacterium sp. RAC06]KPF55149.1 glutamine synthetase [Rhizobium sp. AAP116]MDM7979145.1 glutamine synthetase family protein [Rhizobium sp.]MDM8016185.1 glutamine synthetase family protein [Rhizobium sp.]
MDMAEEAREFFAANPDIEVLEAFVIDVNGVPRGKWIPRERAIDVLTKGMAMPRSVYALDVWGRDVNAAGLAEGTGDPDGICFPVPGTLSRVTWLSRPTAQVLLQMHTQEGESFYADPRQVLGNVMKRFTAAKLTPVVATELEFYLIDPVRSALDPVRPPNTRDGRWHTGQTQVLSISELQDFEEVFHGISTAARAQNVPADTTLRENGPGQYEINLNHVPDALAAADYAVLLKRIVKGVARASDLDATFMAKPYGTQAGSGMHVHFSILNEKGENIYVGEDGPSDALFHSVGGLLESMGESMAIFAPHQNSYRRLRPSEHAPTYASWGFDNRSAAVRVITASKPATRIEHRVAGSDTNPYLVLAMILSAALAGMKEKLSPGGAISGDDHAVNHEPLPTNWDYALQRFGKSSFAYAALGPKYRSLYTACKQQELSEFSLRVTDVEYDAYIRTV